MVSISNAEASVAKLRAHGCEVQFSNYQGGVGWKQVDMFLKTDIEILKIRSLKGLIGVVFQALFRVVWY